MSSRFALPLIFGLSFLGLAASPLRAANVVFNNFGPGLSFDVGSGNPVGNGFDGNDYAEANSFVAAFTGTFQSLTIGLSCVFACPDPVTISLSRNSGGIPGLVLETFTIPGANLSPFGASFAPLVLTSALHPTLLQGVTYWVAAASGLNDVAAWNLNTTGDLSDQGISTDNAATWFAPSGNTPGAFSIDANAVSNPAPEPGSFLLLGTGAFWLAWRFRQSRA